MERIVATPQPRVLFDNFEQALAEVDRLARCPHKQLGNWDLAQICDHLADAFEGSMRGFDFTIPWLVRRLLGPPILRRVLSKRPIPFRPRIPRRLEPPPGRDLAACVTRLAEMISQFESSPQPLAKHPLFGEISRDTWRQIHLVHMAHHLSFLVPS